MLSADTYVGDYYDLHQINSHRYSGAMESLRNIPHPELQPLLIGDMQQFRGFDFRLLRSPVIACGRLYVGVPGHFGYDGDIGPSFQ